MKKNTIVGVVFAIVMITIALLLLPPVFQAAQEGQEQMTAQNFLIPAAFGAEDNEESSDQDSGSSSDNDQGSSPSEENNDNDDQGGDSDKEHISEGIKEDNENTDIPQEETITPQEQPQTPIEDQPITEDKPTTNVLPQEETKPTYDPTGKQVQNRVPKGCENHIDESCKGWQEGGCKGSYGDCKDKDGNDWQHKCNNQGDWYHNCKRDWNDHHNHWCQWHHCGDHHRHDNHRHNHNNDRHDYTTNIYRYYYQNDYSNNHATVILQPDYSHTHNLKNIRLVIGDENAFDTVVNFAGKPENLVVTGLDIDEGEQFDTCAKNLNGGKTICVTSTLHDEDKPVYVDIRIP